MYKSCEYLPSVFCSPSAKFSTKFSVQFVVLGMRASREFPNPTPGCAESWNSTVLFYLCSPQFQGNFLYFFLYEIFHLNFTSRNIDIHFTFQLPSHASQTEARTGKVNVRIIMFTCIEELTNIERDKFSCCPQEGTWIVTISWWPEFWSRNTRQTSMYHSNQTGNHH